MYTSPWHYVSVTSHTSLNWLVELTGLQLLKQLLYGDTVSLLIMQQARHTQHSSGTRAWPATCHPRSRRPFLTQCQQQQGSLNKGPLSLLEWTNKLLPQVWHTGLSWPPSLPHTDALFID